MFGNEYTKTKTKLSVLTEVITKGTTPTTVGFEFVDKGVNFIKIESLSDDEKINKEKCLHISNECNEKLKRSILKEDDILFSIAGTKMGIIAKVTEDILPANTNQALAIIRLKRDSIINVDFLMKLLKTPFIINQIESFKRGVAQINVSLDDLSNLDIITPKIELQNKFAKIVELIDKQKFNYINKIKLIKEIINIFLGGKKI